MATKYKHGGGYKQAAIEEGLNWNEVADYSTSVNWIASEFYPNDMIYLHQENIEYPAIAYSGLVSKIEDCHNFSNKHFLLTHGANEAIANLFYMFNLQEYNKTKSILLVGPTYCEYNKYAELNKFNITKTSFEEFSCNDQNMQDKIIIIVNPNTPLGEHFDIKNQVESILDSGSIVVIDESFIDFIDKQSLYELVPNHANLFIIHSMTKFYGAAGARLGLIISSNSLMKDCLTYLIPPWTISAYDNWFYNIMIPKYKLIKKETHKWIKDSKEKLNELVGHSENIFFASNSSTNFHTLEINQDFLNQNGINNFQQYFLNKYKIYVRPTADFYGCAKTSFRVGMRLPQENEPLWQALKDIG